MQVDLLIQSPQPLALQDQGIDLGQVEAHDATNPTTTPARAKRGKYNSRACFECQRRKVKCMAEKPGQCQTCLVNGTECVFPTESRRRPRRRAPAGIDTLRTSRTDQTALATSGTSSAGTGRPYSLSATVPQLSSATAGDLMVDFPDILARVERIEAALADEAAQAERADMDGASSSVGSEPLSRSGGSMSHPGLFPSGSQGEEPLLRGGTSSHNPIAILDHRVGNHGTQTGVVNSLPHCPFVDCSSFPECCSSDLSSWIVRTRSHDLDHVRTTLNRYFQYLNPHYPCLNEYRFFDDFTKHIVHVQPKAFRNLETVQFAVLVNNILALMKILEDYCTDSSPVPGWQEFSRANHLLCHVTWLGRGNLNTIQSLIFKTLYLLYIEEYNAAYDAIGNTVRLCFQNSLHRQADWTKCTPLEIHLRQRTFWSVYCLDRTVAQVCGMPYLLRDSDCKVDLPASVDDRKLGMTEEMPEDISDDVSPMPYQHGIVRWGKLSAEVWDAIYGINATRPISEEFVVTMDARILLLKDSLSPQLQWRAESVTSPATDNQPPYINRQASILHLRINHLRLLLRRQEMLSFEFHERTAKVCLAVATDSIDAIYTTHFAPPHQELERYSAVTYMTGAMIPVTCIILKEGVDSTIQETAVQAFEKVMAVFRDVASGLALARSTMKRLSRVIKAVESRINGSKTGESLGMDMGPPSGDLSHDPAVVGGASRAVAVLNSSTVQDAFSFLSEDTSFFLHDLMGDPEMVNITQWDVRQ